jgi:uncharacterized membrane protein YdjX (TVP38/TMEM64 family)
MSALRRALTYQIAGLGFAILAAVWLGRHFPVVEYITRAQRKIGEMEVWGGVLYPLLFAGCNVLLLPGGVLALGSGLFFGLWWGFALNIIGSVIGAALAFFISRKLGRNWVERRFLRHRRWVILDEAIAREGWKIIFLSQVHPLFPSSLLNYLYGVTRIRFGPCMLWIALGQVPGMFLYAYLGTLAQLGLRLARGQTHPRFIEYVLWFGGLGATLVTTTLLGRIALRLLAEAEAKTATPAPSAGVIDTKEAAPESERLQPPERRAAGSDSFL